MFVRLNIVVCCGRVDSKVEMCSAAVYGQGMALTATSTVGRRFPNGMAGIVIVKLSRVYHLARILFPASQKIWARVDSTSSLVST
jgi:hypothetical protein